LAQQIKVAAVSYLNTLPLVYGFKKGLMQNQIELSFDFPAKIAEQLIAKQIDVALVPVAVLKKLENYTIISNYCIGANGAVASVCLLSDVPLADIRHIYLDYQSKTSVALLKLLLKNYLHLKVNFIDATEGYESLISGDIAGLVIGDRAFKLRGKFKYVFDLAEVWHTYTKLPFVFAVWVSNTILPQQFITEFDKAVELGLQRIDEIIEEVAYPLYDLKDYYTNKISYLFSKEKQQALQLFLSQI
jgi:chorismate dehydratase